MLLCSAGFSCNGAGGPDTTPSAPVITPQLVLVRSAAGAASGAAFTTQPSVAIRNASGNTETADNASLVTITASAGATIAGTAVAQAQNGVATFTNAGIVGVAGTSYQLTFSRSGLSSAMQNIVPAAGAAKRLALTTKAAGALANGTAFSTSPVVAIRDANGNTVTNSTSSVTLSVSAGGTLVGTATVAAVNGVATFTNVGVSGTVATSYTLTFSSGALTATTQQIALNGGPVSTVNIAPSIVSVAPTQTQQLTATPKDADGSLVSDAPLSWSSSNPAIVTVSTSGLVTGVAVGTATISVSSNGKTGTASLNVLSVTFSYVAAGTSHTCAVSQEGQGYCWGNNSSGQLGDGTPTQRLTPVPVSHTRGFSRIVAGSAHTCASSSSATQGGFCWGDNSFGQMGGGTLTNALTPKLFGSSPSSMYAGAATTCYTAGGYGNYAYCFGRNDHGEIGGLSTFGSNPRLHLLSLGSSHSCVWAVPISAPSSAGTMYCLGENSSGQLGDGTTIQRATATVVQGGRWFITVESALEHTCALTNAGAAYCWGRNDRGQLGDGSTTNRLVPAAVQGGLIFTDLSEGAVRSHTCGLTTAGAAYCWGRNDNGQLGDGTTTDRLTPVAVEGGIVFASLAAGAAHTCGVTPYAQVYCWGDNSSGQLGDGTTTRRLIPTVVR